MKSIEKGPGCQRERTIIYFQESRCEADRLNIAVIGRLDTTTAPELDAALKEALPGVKELVLDFSALDYISSAGLRVLLATISSAGLRVLLSTQKIMSKQGSMKLTGVNEGIMEVFEITGFAGILTIE